MSASYRGAWIASSESTMGKTQTVHDSKQNSGPGAPGVDIISAGQGEMRQAATHRQMLPGKRGGRLDRVGLQGRRWENWAQNEGSNWAALRCRVQGRGCQLAMAESCLEDDGRIFGAEERLGAFALV